MIDRQSYQPSYTRAENAFSEGWEIEQKAFCSYLSGKFTLNLYLTFMEIEGLFIVFLFKFGRSAGNFAIKGGKTDNKAGSYLTVRFTFFPSSDAVANMWPVSATSPNGTLPDARSSHPATPARMVETQKRKSINRLIRKGWETRIRPQMLWWPTETMKPVTSSNATHKKVEKGTPNQIENATFWWKIGEINCGSILLFTSEKVNIASLAFWAMMSIQTPPSQRYFWEYADKPLQRDFGIPVLVWLKSISIYDGQSWFSNHSTSETQNNSHANSVDFTVEFQPKIRIRAASSHNASSQKYWTTIQFSKMLFIRFCSKKDC